MSESAKPRAGKRRDHRPLALGLVLACTAAIGALVQLLPGRAVEVPAAPSGAPPASLPAGFEALRAGAGEPRPEGAPAAEREEANDDPAAKRRREIGELLRSAQKNIRAARYDDAMAILNRAGPLDPRHAPTYLAMGHALSGKGDYAEARRYYEAAINFDPLLADAYFAHAAASEQLGDLEAALGGMRSFLHTVKNPDPYRLQVAQARSAIWEWEAQLGRGEWGATRGVPPGFSAEELRRDGRGVGMKVPIPGSAGPDGVSRYEIKTGDKFTLFKP